MGKIVEKKKNPKLTSRKKKGVNMTPYSGKVKVFQNLDALGYQQKIRE